MRALGMVPAYRGTDDKASVRKNLETLDVGAKYLLRGEAVGIFPEGKTHDREGLEQVRTGAARIAWSAVQDKAALKIVPLGLNYERKERFRSSVWVRIGEPIDAAKFFEGFGEEERKAQRSLTEEIDARLKRAVIHVNQERWQPFLDELEVLLPPVSATMRDPIAALRQRKQLADAVNFFFETDPTRSEAVGNALEQHRTELARAGLSVSCPVLQHRAGQVMGQLLKETLRLFVGLVPAIAGTVHHIVPFLITRGIVQLVKFPGRATVAFNRLMISVPIYAIWYATVWWLLAKYTHVWIAWLWTALMPLAGVMALHYAWRVRGAWRAWGQQILMMSRPKKLRELRGAQIELRRKVERLRQEYNEKEKS
jgi:glycerol-3-phosphate O-acyltransferase/dihydroxyacetone phosphate acyltransferase